MIFNRMYQLSTGSATVAFVRVTFPAGASVTCRKDSTILYGSSTSGYTIFRLPELGNWTVTAVSGGSSAVATVRATVKGQSYPVTLAFRVPTIYQEVQYLQSSGTQFINTGFIFPSNLSRRIEIQYAMLSDLTHTIGGTYNQQSGGASMFGFPAYVESNGLYQLLTSAAYAQSRTSINTVMTVVFNNSSHVVTENGVSVLSLTSGLYDSSLPFFLFGINFDGSLAYGGSTRIYYFRYYENSTNTLLAEYIPCYRKSDSVAGFWDTVSETFLTNNGTGSFTVGPAV